MNTRRWIALVATGPLTACASATPTVEVVTGDTVVTVLIDDCCGDDCDDDGCDDDDCDDGGGGSSTGGGDTGFEVCVDYSPSDAPPVEVSEECIVRPDFVWDPELKLSWPTLPSRVPYHHIYNVPVVGDIDTDAASEIVFVAFNRPDLTHGALTVLDGTTGSAQQFLSVSGEVDYTFAYMAGPALGRLTPTGEPVICLPTHERPFVCVDHEGTVVAEADSGWPDTNLAYSTVSLADIDGDGDTEIIVADLVYSHTGSLIFDGDAGVGSHGVIAGQSYDTGTHIGISTVADLDEDGNAELIIGHAAFTPATGATFWTATDSSGTLLNDGFPAVADVLNGLGQPYSAGDIRDELPEVVVVSRGFIRVLDGLSGTVLQEWDLDRYDNFGNNDVYLDRRFPGGPPTIADIDNDGHPEIGVAGGASYAVYEADGRVVWTTSTQDRSSSVTSSSVFDFERDGYAEVLYSDEIELYVFDESGANRLLSDLSQPHASGTGLEYVTFADLDGAGSAEIIVPSDCFPLTELCNGESDDADSWTGIHVIGSQTQSWADARRVWNQHSYSITNVNDDLSIPSAPTPSWKEWNTFRAAEETTRADTLLADFSSSGELEWCVEDCEDGELETLHVLVSNTGSDTTPATEAQLTRDGIYEDTLDVPALAPGESAWVELPTLSEADWTGMGLQLDTEFDVDECDEDNNLEIELGAWPCD
jgi:hypothetical protein